jgi:SAM-dependent methyltransferase
MVGESLKTNKIRNKRFFVDYLQGKILDIGGGTTPVIPSAQVFDLQHGDAQHILKYLPAESFDCVHSSHCLEHMVDVSSAISQWWSLVKVGGYLILVVPDEDLYEQGVWPSMFNSDHKHTFTISKTNSWSPVSINIRDMVNTLYGAQPISIDLQDEGYDHNLTRKRLTPFRHSLWNYRKDTGVKRLVKHLVFLVLYYPLYVVLVSKKGRFIDQTESESLAQIQVVMKKIAKP